VARTCGDIADDQSKLKDASSALTPSVYPAMSARNNKHVPASITTGWRRWAGLGPVPLPVLAVFRRTRKHITTMRTLPNTHLFLRYLYYQYYWYESNTKGMHRYIW
jgi:hypothetical protein